MLISRIFFSSYFAPHISTYPCNSKNYNSIIIIQTFLVQQLSVNFLLNLYSNQSFAHRSISLRAIFPMLTPVISELLKNLSQVPFLINPRLKITDKRIFAQRRQLVLSSVS